MYIDVQNENLTIKKDRSNKNILVSVPDLIVLLDNEFNSIACEDLRFGLHCWVITMPANRLLTTKKALEVVGPKGFHYDHQYKPFGH